GLSRLYANMEVLSTLGIRPGGSCHYPLAGWSVFSDRIHRLLLRDFYGQPMSESILSPNLVEARYGDSANKSIVLEFDQPVIWDDRLVSQFYLDGTDATVTGGKVEGKNLVLRLSDATDVAQITYLKEASWKQDNLLRGANGIAALTFCKVLVSAAVNRP
ncbi:MAG: DUF2341 domain-containing protein, partial [Planctomycetota bacterium]|nr:DUF2341 domain-containing protein [Planctomycetota bacterium]